MSTSTAFFWRAPGVLRPFTLFKTVQEINRAGGGISTTVIANADVSKPFSLRLSQEISGNADVSAKVNDRQHHGRDRLHRPLLLGDAAPAGPDQDWTEHVDSDWQQQLHRTDATGERCA